MSLLMQALKKAERARQSGLPEEEPAGAADWGLEPLTNAPVAAAPEADVAPVPSPAAGGLELSLEPLEPAPRGEPRATPPEAAPPAAPPAVAAAPARAPRPAEPPIPLQPAAEAVHDPVPPQARHERARAAATPPAAARAERKDGEASARADAAAVRAAAAARARAASHSGKPGVDMARVRVAGLSGILLVLLGTFGYVYWRATTAPGPGAALPMVPMPPPSATGATGIVVAPAEPGAGLPVPAPEQTRAAPAATPFAADPMGTAPPAGATAGTPPAYAAPAYNAPAYTPGAARASASTAPVAAAPAASAERAEPRAPVLTGPVASDDPAVIQAAQQDVAERMERAARQQASEGPPGTAGETGAAPSSAYVPVPPNGTGARGAGDVRIARGSAPAIAPAVQSAYAAFVAGDLAAARQQYDAALRQDPNNRDALLGSAAVAQRENRGALAAAAYARLLELDPQDPDALAGLVALRPGDAARSEAKLRELLKSRPEAAPVQFALGNLYARQGRWPEAQQAYFRAWTAAPANADYAFNLAVGLDRLNQGKLASSYYERALALPGPAAFDRAAVQRRLRELAPGAVPVPAPVAAPGAPAAGN